MTKHTPKRDRKVLRVTDTAIVVKKTRAHRRKRTQRLQALSNGSPSNLYLLSLLQPKIYHGIGIPDQITLPSIKVQTQHRTQLVVRPTTAGNACSWEVYCWSPTLHSNSLALGGNSAGTNVNLVDFSPATTATGNYKLAGVSDFAVSANELALLLSSEFSAARPVSMEVEVEPSASLLNISGEHGIALWSGNQFPAQIDNPVTAAGGLNISYPQVFAPTSIDDVFDNLEEVVPLTRPVRCIWTPQSPSSLDYEGTAPVVIGLNKNNEWVDQPYTNGTLAEDTHYVLPIRTMATTLLDGTTVYDGAPMRSLPYIVWACNGVPTSVASLPVGYATITINWELLPGIVGRNFGTTISPSNPDEVVQANNIMTLVPKATSDSPQSMGAPLQAAAAQAATHLYNGTPRKDAIEGRSIKKTISSVLNVAAPALSMIPKFGGPLAAGASLLAGILG